MQSTFAGMMCLSTPVSLSDWIEGEQFFISCSHRAFKIDGYVAMSMLDQEDEGQMAYKTVTLPSISDPSSSTQGMLFQLQRPEKIRISKKETSKTVNPTDDKADLIADDYTNSEQQPPQATPAVHIRESFTMAGQYRMLFNDDDDDEPEIKEEASKNVNPTDDKADLFADDYTDGEQQPPQATLKISALHTRESFTMAGQYRMLFDDDDDNEPDS